MATLSKTFNTWQTSYDPGKKKSWKVLYVEKWTDKKGKADSLYYIDNVMLKDGKMMIYDEMPPVSATNGEIINCIFFPT